MNVETIVSDASILGLRLESFKRDIEKETPDEDTVKTLLSSLTDKFGDLIGSVSDELFEDEMSKHSYEMTHYRAIYNKFN